MGLSRLFGRALHLSLLAHLGGQSRPDDVRRATVVMIGDERVPACGFDDVGKGSDFAMRRAGLHGRLRVATLKSVLNDIDIFVTTTGNFHIVR